MKKSLIPPFLCKIFIHNGAKKQWKIMKIILFLLLVFPVNISASVYSQNITVSGTVSDVKGETLPGVSVMVKGTTLGTATDSNGAFSFQVVDANSILVFSYIGYVVQEIPVGNRRTFNVTLSEDIKQIEEVVVVGYGTQKQGNLTAAISIIKTQEIETTSATSVAEKLQGKVAGFNIRQNTGEPGSYDNAINIRGFGSPLYVIDGIIRPASVFQKLSGTDIESISILKDASAAIYGMNAANGVVVVTTRQGVKREKTDFQFTSKFGFSSPTETPKMSNAYEYLTLRNEANVNLGLNPFTTKEELDRWKAGGPGYESTDWWGSTFDNFAKRQEYNLSADGGSDRVSYYFNINGVFDGSMLKTDDLFYRRLNFVSNITARLTDRITAKVNVAVMNDVKESPVSGLFAIFRGVVSMLPTRTVYANDNPLYYQRLQDGQAMNPVGISSSDRVGYSRSHNNVYNNLLELSYDVPYIDGLVLKGTGSYDKSYAMGKSVAKDYYLYDYDVESDTYRPTRFNSPASISNSYTNTWYLTLRGQADYKKTVNNDHNISATLVAEARSSASRRASINKYYDFYTNDQIDQATETNATSSGNESESRNMSYIGRATYDYKGRYLVEFAGRYDGSYRYHPDVRWGFFPIISGGWRISDERFMNWSSSVLSNLKIRSSYGKIGEDAGNAFQYIPGFTTGGGWWEFTNGVTTLGLNTPAIVNERMTWTTSKMTDIGIDISFFNERLSFSLDWYQKNRSGLLAYRNVSLPNTYGGTFPQENLNKDRVRGIDLSFEHKNKIGEVSYRVSGNFNYARTTNVYVEQGEYTNSFSNYRSNSEGRYTDLVWVYHVIGRYQTEEQIQNGLVQNGNSGNRYVLPGDFIYEDYDGNGIIDGNDVRPLFYNTTPRMNYGLTLGASYKGFDINVLFQGAALFSARYDHAYTTMFWQEANLPAYFMDRWHKADPFNPDSEWISGKWPAMRTVDQAGLLYNDSDAWRVDCSYLRLKNVSIGYTIPRRFIQKAGLDNLRIFFDASNVYTWCKEFAKMFDPEKVSRAGDYDAGWNYPLMRTYNLGFNISF